MTEDKYQEQCSTVVRLVQSSQYKYRAEQCVCECVGYAVQYAIAIILEIYLYQTSKKQKTNQNKQQHQRTSSSRVTSNRIYNTEKRRDKTRSIYSSSSEPHTCASSSTRTQQLARIKSICTVMI